MIVILEQEANREEEGSQGRYPFAQIESFLRAQRNCMFPDHDLIGNFLNHNTCNFL